MYHLDPPALYACERALDHPASARRIERMLGGLGRTLDAAVPVRDDDIPELIRSHQWQHARRRQGTVAEHRDPALVFATLRFDQAPPIRPVLERCPPGTSSGLVGNLLGHGGLNQHTEAHDSGRVCRCRYQFDTLYGCPHGCAYCRGGTVSVVFTNLEEFVERQVIPIAEANRWQKVFMFNSSLSDTLCFEPEYGLSELLARTYASTPDQHYLIHTKSANVDFLTRLDHQGHTIVLWSLTSATVSRVVEPGSATTEERVAAARRCQEAGYTVRYKLKPIVPVRGWRDECARMIELAFAHTRPDIVGMCMVAWMPADELEACIDPELLDPWARRAMETSADAMRGVTPGPFPHEVRAEVYGFCLDEIRRHDADVPVFLCTESPAMWHEFAERLGTDAGSYVCGCGPQSPPGARRLERLLAPKA